MQSIPYQPGIIAPLPSFAKFISYQLVSEINLSQCLQQLALFVDGESTVLGIGLPLTQKLNKTLPGLTAMPEYQHQNLTLPSDQADLMLWLRAEGGSEAVGDLAHRAMRLRGLLANNFVEQSHCDAFNFNGRDLSGYEDGTENPEGDKALSAAFVCEGEPGLLGASYVAVQPWQHSLMEFKQRSEAEQDDTIGRRIRDNEEFDEAPESAHVKRAAQESFDPEAFMLRRSMPWVSGPRMGLVFVAFGKSFDAFNAIMQRMIGADDGIVDGLFTYSKPQGGGFYWCPPVANGKVDLQVVL
ncbi:Dyp-type peroxidase [Halioxenophilus aromaticivorans]|uniref:Dyp-type peroxidase n=1 Tax=Halioxenophilus aromaticivorans TaxID=1306992 RepID=A0AAV3U3Y7_9ALTE